MPQFQFLRSCILRFSELAVLLSGCVKPTLSCTLFPPGSASTRNLTQCARWVTQNDARIALRITRESREANAKRDRGYRRIRLSAGSLAKVHRKEERKRTTSNCAFSVI